MIRRVATPLLLVATSVSLAGPAVSALAEDVTSVPVDTTVPIDPNQSGPTPEPIDPNSISTDDTSPDVTEVPTTFQVENAEGFSTGTDGLIKVIVEFEPRANVDVDAPDSPVAGMEVDHVYEQVMDGAALSVTPEELRELQNDPTIAAVSPDMKAELYGTTSLWGLDRIDQTSLPLSSTYGPSGTGWGARAYVVDTGVQSGHPQFGGRVARGFTAIGDRRGTEDCDGHGTHVAGTIAGSTFGVAPKATIVPIRVMGCDGLGWSSDIISGLDYILTVDPRDGRSVVNMSLGFDGVNDDVEAAIGRVIGAGIPVVVAAGNDDLNACWFTPSRIPAAITVGASDKTDNRASFYNSFGNLINRSNFGPCVDIFAPGVDIRSAVPGGEASYQGTSMAAPHVVGAIAALAYGGKTTAQAASDILSSSTKGIIQDADSTHNDLLFLNSAEVLSAQDGWLRPAMKGKRYSASFPVSGSHGPFSWQLLSGQLPKGLKLSSSGAITGTTNARSGSTIVVRVTSTTGASSTNTFTIDVIAPLSVATKSMLAGKVGNWYSVQVRASGGGIEYDWRTSGSLPPGLSLSSSGTLEGTPSTAGRYRFSVTVTDEFGNMATKSYTLTVKS